jgi:hypothetical protein
LNYTISLQSSKSIEFYTNQLSDAVNDGQFTQQLRAKAKAANATRLINVNATKSFEIIKYSVDSDDDFSAIVTDDGESVAWYESKGAIIGYIVVAVLISAVIAYYSLRVVIYKQSVANYSPSPSSNSRSHPSSPSTNIRQTNERPSASPSGGVSLYSSAVSNKNANFILGVNSSYRYTGNTDLEAMRYQGKDVMPAIARPIPSTTNASATASASAVSRQTSLAKNERIVQL